MPKVLVNTSLTQKASGFIAGSLVQLEPSVGGNIGSNSYIVLDSDMMDDAHSFTKKFPEVFIRDDVNQSFKSFSNPVQAPVAIVQEEAKPQVLISRNDKMQKIAISNFKVLDSGNNVVDTLSVSYNEHTSEINIFSELHQVKYVAEAKEVAPVETQKETPVIKDTKSPKADEDKKSKVLGTLKVEEPKA